VNDEEREKLRDAMQKLRDAIQQKKPSTCPTCGHCQECGRGGHGWYPLPYPVPYYPRFWWPPVVTWGGSTITVSGSAGYTLTNSNSAE
jgi:hypothetical protein